MTLLRSPSVRNQDLTDNHACHHGERKQRDDEAHPDRPGPLAFPECGDTEDERCHQEQEDGDHEQYPNRYPDPFVGDAIQQRSTDRGERP